LVQNPQQKPPIQGDLMPYVGPILAILQGYMRVQNLVAVTLIISTGALLTACQKKVVGQTLHAAEINHSSVSTTNSLNKKDLGVLPLSNHVSTTISLGKNKECTITPTLLKSGNIQIILAMITTGTDGRPQGMNVARVLAHSGEPFDVAIGDMSLAFTPQLAVQ
jgi:hypothetical protein